MEKLCEAQQRWPELADALGRRLKLVGDDEAPELTLRLALVRETRLLDKSGALELYGELLAKNPANAGALARVEALVQREPQNQVAVELLLTAYRRNAEPLKLAALLEARVQVSPDAVERKTLLTELATVREGQGEPELAFLALYRAYKEDPNDRSVRTRLVADGTAAGLGPAEAHIKGTRRPAGNWAS